MADVAPIVSWLGKGAPGAPTPMAVIERVGTDLGALGVPVHRIMAFVRTLHPHILGRRFLWVPGAPVKVAEAGYGFQSSPAYHASPIARVILSGSVHRQRLDGDDVLEDDAHQDLRKQGFTEVFVAPMTFMSGQVHAISFATKHADRFSDDDIAAIEAVLPALTRVGEILALQRTAANLLSTYVGRNAGDRILAGQIRRGDSESMRAIIWCSDLRGFTALAGRVSPAELIAILNELFECQVPAIEKHGGEVLKFIGDGLLAIFPVGGDKTPEAQAEAALAASDEASLALAARNAQAREQGGIELRFGLALHLGDIVYGNIGGAGRLDFTCIGTAVNVAARLESVASGLGRSRVVSEEVAALTTRAVDDLGAFELKGVTELRRVFGV